MTVAAATNADNTSGAGARRNPGLALGFDGRVLSVVASACLWTLIQRGALTLPFGALEVGGRALGSLLTVVCIVLGAIVLGALGWRASRLLSCSRMVVPAGCLGALAAVIGTLVPGSWGWPLVACLGVEALAYCVLFLAWCQAFVFQMGSQGPSQTLLDQLAALVVSIAVTQVSARVVFGGVHAVDIAAFVVASLCFGLWTARTDGAMGAWVAHSRPVAANESQRTRDVLWLVAIACAFFFAGVLSYLPHLNETAVDRGAEDVLTVGFTLLFLAPLMMVCLRAGDASSGSSRGVWGALLAVTLVLLVAFFVLVLSLFSESAMQYGFARCVRRASRVATFLFLLLFSYRMGFSAVRCFALGFLVPMYAPKCLVYSLGYVLPDASVFSGNQVLLFTLAMALTLCIVIVLFLNFDGGLVRQMAGGVEEALPVDGREALCARIGEERGLTDRECEILDLLSQGYSGAKVCEELSISRGTLNTHSTALYRKLGIHSKQELIDLVHERASR